MIEKAKLPQYLIAVLRMHVPINNFMRTKSLGARIASVLVHSTYQYYLVFILRIFWILSVQTLRPIIFHCYVILCTVFSRMKQCQSLKSTLQCAVMYVTTFCKVLYNNLQRKYSFHGACTNRVSNFEKYFTICSHVLNNHLSSTLQQLVKKIFISLHPY